jgi:cytidine deaminase
MVEISPKDLYEKAKAAIHSAYAPYSGFRVGAVLLTEEGDVFSGCNVENISYGLTICAERSAIANAISSLGGKIKIRAIACAELEGRVFSPCGACRQTIREFGEAETKVIFYSEEGLLCLKLEELLPFGFGIL